MTDYRRCGRCGNPIPAYQGFSNRVENPFFGDVGHIFQHDWKILCFDCQKKLINFFDGGK